jgi:CO dehydrogenase maturation factor
MIIAISGKGGSGKTTIASNLARYCRAMGYNVYAIDADPDGNLGSALGLSGEEMAALKPIIEMREFIDENAGDGSLYLRKPDIGEIADQFSADAGGIKFLRMGSAKPAYSSCYCAEHSFLRALLGALLLGEKDAVVLDMSAGIEHLVRGTVKGADAMLIMAEAWRASIDAAKRIREYSERLNVGKAWYLCNKIRNEREELYVKANFTRSHMLGVIRFSERIAENAMKLRGGAAARSGAKAASGHAGEAGAAHLIDAGAANAGEASAAHLGAAASTYAGEAATAHAGAATPGDALRRELDLQIDSRDMAGLFAKLLDSVGSVGRERNFSLST